MTDEEVTEARKMAVPKRTAQDTQYFWVQKKHCTEVEQNTDSKR